MSVENIIKKSIKKNIGAALLEVSKLGNGACGSVYKVECGKTKTFALKISEHVSLMEAEYKMLSFLREKTESKIPKVHYFDREEQYGIIAMEYIDGIGGGDERVNSIVDKEKLANSIVDNLIDIQKTHNDKFGPYDDPRYDTWYEYYKAFSDGIYAFSKEKRAEGAFSDNVMRAVELSFGLFDTIFGEEDFLPTLIHGDYWMSNFIIDEKSGVLLSVVDPFNVMWADPEYELFALDVGYGIELGLYDLYKSKVKTTKYCDVKLELYALYSEVLWYKTLGSIDHSFLSMRADRLMNVMERFKLI